MSDEFSYGKELQALAGKITEEFGFPEYLSMQIIERIRAEDPQYRKMRNALLGIAGNGSTRLWSIAKVGELANAALPP